MNIYLQLPTQSMQHIQDYKHKWTEQLQRAILFSWQENTGIMKGKKMYQVFILMIFVNYKAKSASHIISAFVFSSYLKFSVIFWFLIRQVETKGFCNNCDFMIWNSCLVICDFYSFSERASEYNHLIKIECIRREYIINIECNASGFFYLLCLVLEDIELYLSDPCSKHARKRGCTIIDMGPQFTNYSKNERNPHRAIISARSVGKIGIIPGLVLARN